MSAQRRRFLPAGQPGSFQTRMLCLVYCETTIDTWCLTFRRCLFSICCIWKLQLLSERMPMLSQCQCSQSAAGNRRLKNTAVCQRKGNSALCFHLVWLVFCLRFSFVYVFLLMFDVAWLVVGGTWSLPAVGLLSSWVPCHLGSCHPGEGDTPCWSAHC